MNGHSTSTWRSALSLMSMRLLLEQMVLAAAVFLLFAAWLRVPDASGFDVAVTVLLTLLIVAAAGCGEAVIVLRLCGRGRTVRLLLLGTALLAAGAALWFGWSALLDDLRGNDGLRAGYYNSQLPHRLRYFFTYQHILLWLGWMWNTLTWIGAGVIAAAIACGTGSPRPLRALGCVLRSVVYWVTLLAGSFAAVWVTSSLADWMPGHGLRREMLSLVVRLSATVLFDAVALCLLLAVIASCCRRVAVEEDQATPAGTPDLSQPRTEGNP